MRFHIDACRADGIMAWIVHCAKGIRATFLVLLLMQRALFQHLFLIHCTFRAGCSLRGFRKEINDRTGYRVEGKRTTSVSVRAPEVGCSPFLSFLAIRSPSMEALLQMDQEHTLLGRREASHFQPARGKLSSFSSATPVRQVDYRLC